MWEVYKFGGTSITKIGFDVILDIIKNKTKKKVIVLSALSGVTDLLIDLVNNFSNTKLNKIKKKYLDLAYSLNLKKKNIEKFIEKFTELENLFKETNKDNIIIAYGEILSTYLLSLYSNIKLLDSREIIIKYKTGFSCKA